MIPLEDAVVSGWGWKLVAPIVVIETNAFGNVLLQAGDGHFYRIVPEDLACINLGDSPGEFERLRQSEEFMSDWNMERLVKESEAAQGPLDAGQCYHLAIPSVMGGAYEQENIRRITMTEWISAAGSLAEQIEDIPDGSSVKLTVIE